MHGRKKGRRQEHGNFQDLQRDRDASRWARKRDRDKCTTGSKAKRKIYRGVVVGEM